MRAVTGIASFEPELMEESELDGYLDRLLSSKPKLDDRLINSLNIEDDGRVWIQPEQDRVKRIVKKVVCGLYALKYGVGSNLSDFRTVIAQHSHSEIPQPIIAAMYYFPGIRRKQWIAVQAGRFRFMFARGWLHGQPPIWCFLEIANTIFAAVECPEPRGRRGLKLKAKPW